jgi:hypothetical protein
MSQLSRQDKLVSRFANPPSEYEQDYENEKLIGYYRLPASRSAAPSAEPA